MTPVRDLGILPSPTSRPTRVILTRVAAAPIQPSPEGPTRTPVPTPVPYTGPDCVPHGQPVGGALTQRYSRWHSGIDLALASRSPVQATHSGQVVFAGWRWDGYGNLVIIQNNRFITYYAHNAVLQVSAGQVVKAGDIIALSGSTGWSSGPHVHYEIRIDDIPINPLTFNPQDYQTC
jgi:murein DD-endopeptidase MepM/ murein hydrolase activator NlpD